MMRGSTLRPSDWLKGGFPEPKTVSDNQRRYIYRRAHLLKKVLTPEQQVAMRMMRFEYWLSNLSKFDASAIIAKMKVQEDRGKEVRIAKGLKRKRSAPENYSGNVCSLCGGDLDESNPVAPACKVCGKGSIRVQL